MVIVSCDGFFDDKLGTPYYGHYLSNVLVWAVPSTTTKAAS
jgi:hypothetical protein